MKLEIEIGHQAEDIVTGFKGTVTGYVRYLTGCDQVMLSPAVDAETPQSRPPSEWFDTNRIIDRGPNMRVVNIYEKARAVESTPSNRGGPSTDSLPPKN